MLTQIVFFFLRLLLLFTSNFLVTSPALKEILSLYSKNRFLLWLLMFLIHLSCFSNKWSFRAQAAFCLVKRFAVSVWQSWKQWTKYKFYLAKVLNRKHGLLLPNKTLLIVIIINQPLPITFLPCLLYVISVFDFPFLVHHLSIFFTIPPAVWAWVGVLPRKNQWG